MARGNDQPIVITGMGLVSPIGSSPAAAWSALCGGHSGVKRLQRLSASELPIQIAGEVSQFRGEIDDFGPLEKDLKRSIKKGLKLMCREIQMGVAAAQLAMLDAGLSAGSYDPERTGCIYGADYIMTIPEEFSEGIQRCLEDDGVVNIGRWGQEGLPQVEPLWLLKYLPNMPASHVAIYNDLRGPSNSLTVREASANMAVTESVTTIRRGAAEIMVAGATGTRVHPIRCVHIALQEELAAAGDDPATACRPFDLNRTGMVLGEGAAVVVLETLRSAQARGARIYGEVIGYCTSIVADRSGAARYEDAFRNVLQGSLQTSGMTPQQVGHVHAHGLATHTCDRAEAQAIRHVFGENAVPVTAAKSYMGNLGAGSGLVELITSVLALREGQLFPVLNWQTPDPDCPIDVVHTLDRPAGTSFINLSITPQGQASAVAVGRLKDQ